MVPKEKNIQADPNYIVKISVLTGIVIGLYMAYAALYDASWIVIFGMSLILLVIYLMELTRTITLTDNALVFSRFLSHKKEIDLADIAGMYIYSFNKKFLSQHAYTTKLVVTKKDGKKIKFTLSSLDNRAVLNMMKENFGINNCKMYVAKKENKVPSV